MSRIWGKLPIESRSLQNWGWRRMQSAQSCLRLTAFAKIETNPSTSHLGVAQPGNFCGAENPHPELASPWIGIPALPSSGSVLRGLSESPGSRQCGQGCLLRRSTVSPFLGRGASVSRGVVAILFFLRPQKRRTLMQLVRSSEHLAARLKANPLNRFPPHKGPGFPGRTLSRPAVSEKYWPPPRNKDLDFIAFLPQLRCFYKTKQREIIGEALPTKQVCLFVSVVIHSIVCLYVCVYGCLFLCCLFAFALGEVHETQLTSDRVDWPEKVATFCLSHKHVSRNSGSETRKHSKITPSKPPRWSSKSRSPGSEIQGLGPENWKITRSIPGLNAGFFLAPGKVAHIHFSKWKSSACKGFGGDPT